MSSTVTTRWNQAVGSPGTTSLAAPAFIVGMSRAGTTWMARCLSRHPDVSVFGETAYWGRRFVAPLRGRGLDEAAVASIAQSLKQVRVFHESAAKPGEADRLADVLGDVAASLTASSIDPGDLYRQLTATIASREGTSCVVEKTPHHINWVDRILRYLPDARFIVHIREPYGFMRSYKHQGDRKPDDVRRAFNRRYHPLACAVVWRGYARSADALLSKHSDRAMLVRFEEIQTGGMKVLNDVQDFLNLRRCDVSLPPQNSSFPNGNQPELSESDVFAMNLIAAREIERWDFRIRRARCSSAAKMTVLTSIPWWAARNMLSMSRNTSGSLVRYLWRWLS